MIKLKNKNAKMEFSILLLSIATLVLIVTSLLVFSSRTNSFGESIAVSDNFEELYAKAEKFDFYLSNMISKLEVPISYDSFRIKFNEYKDKNGNYLLPDFNEEFRQIESQIDGDHISPDRIHFTIVFQKILEHNGLKDSFKYTHEFEYNGAK